MTFEEIAREFEALSRRTLREKGHEWNGYYTRRVASDLAYDASVLMTELRRIGDNATRTSVLAKDTR